VLSERQVAIKIIDPKNVEYEFIKELQHPNLISYYNSFLENGKRYIVLEYLPKSLAEIARKKKFN
jgi:serine/threonine protein kinase